MVNIVNIEFVDAPPAPIPLGRSAHPVNVQVADACRSMPGKWAKYPHLARWDDWDAVDAAVRRNRLSSLASHINKRRGLWVGFEAVIRQGQLFIRYRGGGA